MESFLVAARVVFPMAMLMAVGVVIRIVKITDPATMKKVDTLIFKIFTPCLVFNNTYNIDFSHMTNPYYLLYGVVGLFLCFAVAVFVIPKVVTPRPTATVYAQMFVRPNFVIFGAAVAQSIYGPGNFGLVMLIGAVAIPVYSTMAAIILELGRGGHPTPAKFGIAVLKNPIFVGTALGLIANLIGLKIPSLIFGVIKDLGSIATPLSFLSIGVGLSFGAYAKRKLVLSATLVKLILIPMVFILGAMALGFRGEELCGIMILFAAPVAVASYPAAVAMDADGEFAGQLVAYTTIGCLFSIFLWTLLLNSLHFM